jgi:hypothetical protein
MKNVIVHDIISLPLHLSNNGEDGLPKSLSLAGVTRQRISPQCQSYNLQRTDEFRALEELDPGQKTHRTALVAEALLAPALTTAGIENAAEWADVLVNAWVSNKVDQDDDEGDDGTKKSRGKKKVEDKKKAKAPLVIGENEVRLMVGLARAALEDGITQADELANALVAKPTKQPGNLKTAIALFHKAGQPQQSGLSGALFGRMVTGVLGTTIDRCVRLMDAVTVHEARIESDFLLASDQYAERGGSYIGTRELGGGVFYRQMVIDLDQMVRNGVDPATIVPELVLAYISASPVGAKAPFANVTTLVEVGGRGVTYLPAFEAPVESSADAASALRQFVDAAYRKVGTPKAHGWLDDLEPNPTQFDSLRQWVKEQLA